MIITRLEGGLGNQLFQYAIGRHLSIKNNTGLILDTSNYLIDKNNRHYELYRYNIKAKTANIITCMFVRFGKYIIPKITQNIRLPIQYIKEQNNYFNTEILSEESNIILDGYWQSEEYFKNIRDIILDDLTLLSGPDKENKKMLKRINNSNSVCLHVRRDDLVSNPTLQQFHGNLTPEYYKKAIGTICDQTIDPDFFIFSDEPEWCKRNIITNRPHTYVDINGPDKAPEDLLLMSACKHFIIANSSFSWWGAWLSGYKEKIIIAPKRWYKNCDEGDTVPNRWLRI
ncbi:alpha-1,2-fucosyltransferase [Thermodesulfobacteriota bacterium]